jgi:hypothetical protein
MQANGLATKGHRGHKRIEGSSRFKVSQPEGRRDVQPREKFEINNLFFGNTLSFSNFSTTAISNFSQGHNDGI